MPKFSFPMPGRKSHKVTREAERPPNYPARSPVSPAVSTSSGLSKAQRFFGTDNDLNIDSPTRDDDSWMVPSSRSSVMSISISESTQLTGQTEDMENVPDEDKWDGESGVFPHRPQLQTRASSTILGARYGEANHSVTDATGRLRNEDSSSTLKSFYDRHNSPLAISQQTSASSSRDLALRKGLPKVVPTSPLLHVQSVESLYLDSFISGQQNGHAKEKSPKKKPAKLDFSKLFPGSGRRASKVPPQPTPSPLPSRSGGNLDGSRNAPNKLRKAYSKDSLRSQHSTISQTRQPSSASHTAGSDLQPQAFTSSPLSRLPMDQIPEHLIPERRSTLRPQHRTARQEDTEHDSSSFGANSHSPRIKDSISVPPARPWEKSSAPSISSQNTKSSHRTANSALSNVDLQHNSILSLSDSEGEDDSLGDLLTPPTSSTEKVQRLLDGTIPTNGASHRMSRTERITDEQSVQIVPRRLSTKMRRTLDQFPSIPESSSTSQTSSKRSNTARDSTQSALSHRQSSAQSHSRQGSGGRHLSVPKDPRNSMVERKEPRRPSSSQRGTVRNGSQKSQRSLQQPTPPLSPSSMEFRVDPEDSNRFMAVTKQEEALLAALRLKRAKMKEEHDGVYRSPPRTAEEIKTARYSDVSSRYSTDPNKETVLMYLDTPISEAQRIYTAEPSPDLTDFLGFMSDEDSTPRNSWKVAKAPGAPRPDSTISPNPRAERLNTPTSSTARLSAVGVFEDFLDTSSAKSSGSRTNHGSVRFSSDTKQRSAEDSDDEVMWRV